MNIKDIAKLAGVSTMTVSRVINNSSSVGDKTRENIEKIIKEHNYTPNAMARNLSSKQSNTIGVIIPDVENSFFGSLIKGINIINDKENLNTILYNTNSSLKKESKAIDLMIEQRVKGCIICVVSSFDSYSNIQKLVNHNIPFILIDRELFNHNYSGLFLDDIYGGYLATKSLIENGHKNIAIITGDFKTKNAQDRYFGYLKALSEFSIPLNENYVYKGDFKIESGINFIENTYKNNLEITAVFSSNNFMTLGVLKGLKDNKYLKKISIISFDNPDYFNILETHISSIQRDIYKMGKDGMLLLLKQINTPNKIIKNFITPTLILNGSEKLKNEASK
jgi:LacI family transcriptional regulator